MNLSFLFFSVFTLQNNIWHSSKSNLSYLNKFMGISMKILKVNLYKSFLITKLSSFFWRLVDIWVVPDSLFVHFTSKISIDSVALSSPCGSIGGADFSHAEGYRGLSVSGGSSSAVRAAPALLRRFPAFSGFAISAQKLPTDRPGGWNQPQSHWQADRARFISQKGKGHAQMVHFRTDYFLFWLTSSLAADFLCVSAAPSKRARR